MFMIPKLLTDEHHPYMIHVSVIQDANYDTQRNQRQHLSALIINIILILLYWNKLKLKYVFYKIKVHGFKNQSDLYIVLTYSNNYSNSGREQTVQIMLLL